jgi:hypothetical protein
LTTAVVAGIAGVAGIANMASAVNLNPDGLGQVLLYPYYTVNAGQGTLLSVVNTTGVGKVVKVRFLEGYNSREVLDFNLFLSRYDVWTANVFKLSDAGQGGDGAAIFSSDNSCTAPLFGEGPLGNGFGYQQFLHYAYTGSYADGGPSGDDRTLEGHFEMISMADILRPSTLNDMIEHVASVPPDCGTVAQGGETDPEQRFETLLDNLPPSGGLFGAAAVVNTANGTFYGYNADAVDGFTAVTLAHTTGSLSPSLTDVGDANGLTSTAYVFNNGALVTAVYPFNDVEAVSALLDASNVYNEWEHTSDGAIGTDWVVNFPTKRFYVDTLYNASAPEAPFESAFGAPGQSCDVIGINVFDREENTTQQTTCGFSPCPPGAPPSSLCYETNVISFGGTSILASNLTRNLNNLVGSAGWLGLSFTDAIHGGTAPATDAHASLPDNNGVVFYGLPTNGFMATDFIVTTGGATLGNYSGVFRHRISRCIDTAAVGACS